MTQAQQRFLVVVSVPLLASSQCDIWHLLSCLNLPGRGMQGGGQAEQQQACQQRLSAQEEQIALAGVVRSLGVRAATFSCMAGMPVWADLSRSLRVEQVTGSSLCGSGAPTADCSFDGWKR